MTAAVAQAQNKVPSERALEAPVKKLNRINVKGRSSG
jgi:hypothetical protein